MNGYDNGKTSFAVDFSSAAGVFPRQIKKKKKKYFFIFWVALCTIENYQSLNLFLFIFFFFWEIFSYASEIQCCVLRTPENSTSSPRRTAMGVTAFFSNTLEEFHVTFWHSLNALNQS